MASKKAPLLINSLINGTLDKELRRLDVNQAIKLLNQNSPNHFGRTVLHLACENGHYEAVKCCLEFGANPNKTSGVADLQKSPLHVLLIKLPHNSVEIAKLLLAYGADPKTVDSGKFSALDYANRHNHKPLIQLIKNAASIFQSAHTIALKESPTIHKEIELKVEGSNEKIIDLISKCFLRSLSPFDHNNWSIINCAIVNSNFQLAEFLVEHTLEIPSSKNPSNLSPLHLLTIFRCQTLFEKLIAKFPRLLLSRDNEKNTPFHLACRNGVADLVRLMAPEGRPLQYVDVNSTNIRGMTPLQYAAREGHIDTTEYLLQFSRTNCIDNNKQTFLYKALLSERLDLITKLLSNHSNTIKQIVDIQDKDGRTFLQLAVAKGLNDIVSHCLKLNSSINTVGCLTIQGYKKFVAIFSESDDVSYSSERKYSTEESTLSISMAYSVFPPYKHTTSSGSSPRGSNNNSLGNSLGNEVGFSSQRSSLNTSDNFVQGASIESKNSDISSSKSFSLSATKYSQTTNIPQEQSRNVVPFQNSLDFTMDTTTSVTILTESLLLDDLSVFQLIIDYILEKKIPVTTFPDFQSAMCLVIRLKMWKAVETFLKLTYNEKIEYEIKWDRLYLTNEALDRAIPDITSFKFLTDTSMEFQNLLVLDIHNNELTEIPSIVYQMKDLRRLSLINNRIEFVTREIFAIKELRELNLSGNPVSFVNPPLDEPLTPLLSSRLDKLDIQKCGLDYFPPVIEELHKLHDLNISQNNICVIPSYIWKHKGIRKLNVSHNKLSYLKSNTPRRPALIQSDNKTAEVRLRPPRQFSTYYDKGRGRERFQTLPINSDSMPVRSVQRASFAHSIIPGLQFNIQQDNELSELDLSHNEFVDFPTDMSELTPTLKKLIMSNNRIQSIYLSHIPFTLIELNLDSNLIDTFSCEDPFYKSTAVTESIICGDQHDALNWLKTISLNNNKLKNFPLLVHSSEIESSIIRRGDTEKRLSFPVLEVLSILNNKLTTLSSEIQYQSSIQEIHLDGNAELTKLPHEIGYLKCFNRLVYISIQDCPKISNIPPHIYNKGNINTQLLMLYYRAQLKGSVKSNLVKLMVIGSFNQGKTSLLRRLKGLYLTEERIPTKGVEIDSWKCDFGRGKSITFVTWDFAGQEEYYATHQCFLSTGALYILCFSLETFHQDEKSLQNMTEWLQSIQLRAPNSPVIIVGTHLDKVNELTAQEIKEILENRFLSKRRRTIEQLPHIIDVMLVCCVPDKKLFSKLNKKMDLLKERILDIVGHLSMQYNRIRQTISYIYKQDADSKSPTLLLNQETPKDYENLREKLYQVSSTLLSAEKPPILRDSELKVHAEHIIDNPDDLFDAVEHLHMQGSILHFNTPLLKDVYFLDPNWLCKQMAKVIGAHTDTNNSNGLVALVDLESNLKDISQFWNKFVRLLEQFQIMLRFSEEEVLIPSQLPIEPDNLVGLYKTFTEKRYPDPFDKYFVRIWPLVNVPHGFWSRLLCRVAQDPVIMSLVSKKGKATVSILGTLSKKNKPPITRTISDAKLQRFDSDINWNFWRNGLQLLNEDGKIQFEIIQLSEDCPELVDHEDIAAPFCIQTRYRILSIVHVHYKTDDLACQLFVRLTQHINSLFEAWFPGILTDYQVPSYYPCPNCFYHNTNKTLPNLQDDEHVGKFIKFGNSIWSVYCEEDCFQRSREGLPIVCHWHDNIDIHRLAPDVTLLDVGAERMLDMNTIRLGSQLGAGTYGVVYKAEIWDRGSSESIPCAVKLFVGNTLGRSYEHIIEHMSNEEQWNSYQELRKELSPMVNLNHPNLSLLLGVTISPLQIVMGLARKGSLLTMINKYNEKKAIFHPRMAASAILQIASGLNYLHSNNLVHLDLKAANVLVWDFPDPDEQTPESEVLLKLADYGTVLHCDTLGVRMSNLVGTPGYIAPEIVLFSGKQSFTSKADVFSFAMVLYEILSYRPPFVNFDNEHDQKWAPAQGRRPILRAEEKYSPCLFQDLMTACWAADPDDRPTMEECEIIASNPLFCEIRSIMSFEKMVRFSSHAVVTNTLKQTRARGDSMMLHSLDSEGGMSDSVKRYNSMGGGSKRQRVTSEINFGSLLTGENTQIWLGAFNNPFANKVAIVQYLHGHLGSRVWFVDVLPPDGEACITVLTTVDKQVWLGTNEGKVLVIDATCFKKLSIEYANLMRNEIHAIKHIEIMNKVFISFRSNDLAILEDKLDIDETGNHKFRILSFITTDSPVFTFHPIQKSINSWEVWGTKDNCTIEVFPQLPNGKVGKNFSKSLTVDPSVRYQRFNCVASCFREENPVEGIDGYAVVWISEWQRATAYVMGAVSRTLRAGVPIPKDPKDPDAIKEVIKYGITYPSLSVFITQ